MSAPRQTTTRQTTASASGRSGGFDFARAASLLTDAASRAGAAIMAHFHEPAVEIKGDNSPVTRADRDSEAIILAALATLAPDVRVVSEEDCGGTIGPLPERFFLVDPLDGTKEFIKKRSDFTVNIALIEERRPRFGLVYAPARALLAVTTAEGKAVEAELPPNASGADLMDAVTGR
ncbi:MAG: 3'(2'),5'-bisphosphate nucleotidase CysQ family protein [Methyloceanibacter sp.]